MFSLSDVFYKLMNVPGQKGLPAFVVHLSVFPHLLPRSWPKKVWFKKKCSDCFVQLWKVIFRRKVGLNYPVHHSRNTWERERVSELPDPSNVLPHPPIGGHTIAMSVGRPEPCDFFFFFLVWNCSAVYVQVTLLFWVSVSSWSKWGGGRNLFHGVQPYDGGEVTLWAVRYLMSVFTKWGRKNKSNKVIFRLPPFLSSLWLCPSPLLGSGKPVGLPAFCKWGKVPF